MLTSSLRRKSLLFALAAIFASRWEAVAEPSPDILRKGHVLEETSSGLVNHLWSFLLGVWTKEGCNIDPNGAKEGCGIDPDGKAGCDIDPNGTKAGCHIDPNGIPNSTP